MGQRNVYSLVIVFVMTAASATAHAYVENKLAFKGERFGQVIEKRLGDLSIFKVERVKLDNLEMPAEPDPIVHLTRLYGPLKAQRMIAAWNQALEDRLLAEHIRGLEKGLADLVEQASREAYADVRANMMARAADMKRRLEQKRARHRKALAQKQRRIAKAKSAQLAMLTRTNPVLAEHIEYQKTRPEREAQRRALALALAAEAKAEQAEAAKAKTAESAKAETAGTTRLNESPARPAKAAKLARAKRIKARRLARIKARKARAAKARRLARIKRIAREASREAAVRYAKKAPQRKSQPIPQITVKEWIPDYLVLSLVPVIDDECCYYPERIFVGDLDRKTWYKAEEVTIVVEVPAAAKKQHPTTKPQATRSGQTPRRVPADAPAPSPEDDRAEARESQAVLPNDSVYARLNSISRFYRWLPYSALHIRRPLLHHTTRPVASRWISRVSRSAARGVRVSGQAPVEPTLLG
jgi:hypothetical protein